MVAGCADRRSRGVKVIVGGVHHRPTALNLYIYCCNYTDSVQQLILLLIVFSSANTHTHPYTYVVYSRSHIVALLCQLPTSGRVHHHPTHFTSPSWSCSPHVFALLLCGGSKAGRTLLSRSLLLLVVQWFRNSFRILLTVLFIVAGLRCSDCTRSLTAHALTKKSNCHHHHQAVPCTVQHQPGECK